jgi:hypothetical protein
LIVALVVAIAAAVWVAEHPRSSSRGARAAPDSIAALSPYNAYQRALVLSERREFSASLPYFRQALATPPDAWQPYSAFATSLFQSTFEARAQRGRPCPVVRSSRERVAYLREAARALDTAERLAQSPTDRAMVIASRAQQLGVWGMSWNSFSEYVRGSRLAPGLKRRAEALATRMRNPPSAGDSVSGGH